MEARNDRIQFSLDVIETVLLSLKPLLHLLQSCRAIAFFHLKSSNVSFAPLDFFSNMLLLVCIGCLAQPVFRTLQFTGFQLLIALNIQELRSRTVNTLSSSVYNAMLEFKLREEYLSGLGGSNVLMNSTDLSQYFSHSLRIWLSIL